MATLCSLHYGHTQLDDSHCLSSKEKMSRANIRRGLTLQHTGYYRFLLLDFTNLSTAVSLSLCFSKLPSWARAVVPKIFYVTEKAWNYYPYTITGNAFILRLCTLKHNYTQWSEHNRNHPSLFLLAFQRQ